MKYLVTFKYSSFYEDDYDDEIVINLTQKVTAMLLNVMKLKL